MRNYILTKREERVLRDFIERGVRKHPDLPVLMRQIEDFDGNQISIQLNLIKKALDLYRTVRRSKSNQMSV